MAQENANICHAAIAFKNDFAANQVAHQLEVVAATGIELASVRRRTDVVGAPLVYEFDLLEAIADDDLIILTGQGPIKPNSDGTPSGVPIPATLPINVQRAIGDTTQRRFWIILIAAIDVNCAVQFNRIAPLDAPLVLIPAP